MTTENIRYGVAKPADIAGMTGLEALNAMLQGVLPAPQIGRTMGFTLTEASDGVAIFEGECGEHLLNPLGIVHGGFALTLIDSAAGCAAHTTLPPGVGYTTLETKVNFCRALQHNSGRVQAVGTVISRGKQIITAEARITDSADRLIAHGTSTLIVLQPR